MKKLMILAVATVFFVGCKSELDNKPVAEVNPEATTEVKKEEVKKEEPKAAETELAINTETSKIDWVGAKVTGDHKGTFTKWEGKAWIGDKGLTKVWFEIDASSLKTYDKMPDDLVAKLEGHLKSPDFLDAEKHPKASFTSTAVTEKVAGDFTHEVTGDFEIRGKKKSITFPATVTKSGLGVKANTEFKINRKDFGMEFPGKPDDLIKDEILMKINLETKSPQKG